MSTHHTDTLPQLSFVERRATPRRDTEQPNHSVWRGPIADTGDSLNIEAEIRDCDPYDSSF